MITFKTIKRLFFNFVKQSFLFTTLLLYSLSNAQSFDKVDAIALHYSSKITSPESLANTIANDFRSDTERVRALYIYLTNNISYNLNEYKYGADNYSFSYSSKEELEQKIRQRNLEIIRKTITEKRAICEGYSMLFNEVCSLLNIKCKNISGYTRTPNSIIGSLPLQGKHAWNAVSINNEWKFIDTTWGAGYSRDNNHWVKEYDEHYFFTRPNELLTTHFPEVKKWQLVKKPLTEKEFSSQPIYSALFFNENLNLISPTSGILKTNKEGILRIKFKNLKPDAEIGYAFQKDYYLTTIIPEFKGTTATILIPTKGKRNTTLNILVNTEMVLQYKIN